MNDSFPRHEPSADDLTRMAARMIAEAGGVESTTPVPAPSTAQMRILPTAVDGVTLQAMLAPAAVAARAPHATFGTSPAPGRTPPDAENGIRAFVARLRGGHGPLGGEDGSLGAAAAALRAAAAAIHPVSVPAPSSVARPDLPASVPFDVERVRADFPVLAQRVNGHPLAWFDNAATTQKPRQVIDAISRFYEQDNSNIHRGAHTLAARATDAYEGARSTVAAFLGAGSPDEIVFVRGTTEGINLVAGGCGPLLSPGDEIVLTELEHHANIVPWQLLAERTGAVIRVAPIDDAGEVVLDAYAALLSSRTRLVALSHASNSLGTILPVETMTALAKARGIRVLVDGAQSVSHFPVDVRRIGCDFYVFSGHKIFGPTGIGAVWGTAEAWRTLRPWQGGGNMIRDVTFARTTYAEPPAKFEAGTPNVADAIGLGAALDYVTALGRERIAAREHLLLEHATERLQAVPGLRLVGTAAAKVGVLSFVLPGIDPIEIGRALDGEGFAVRAGHHCAQPSLRHFGLEATVRPSLAFYNTAAEIDRLADAVTRIARRGTR